MPRECFGKLMVPAESDGPCSTCVLIEKCYNVNMIRIMADISKTLKHIKAKLPQLMGRMK